MPATSADRNSGTETDLTSRLDFPSADLDTVGELEKQESLQCGTRWFPEGVQVRVHFSFPFAAVQRLATVNTKSSKKFERTRHGANSTIARVDALHMTTAAAGRLVSTTWPREGPAARRCLLRRDTGNRPYSANTIPANVTNGTQVFRMALRTQNASRIIITFTRIFHLKVAARCRRFPVLKSLTNLSTFQSTIFAAAINIWLHRWIIRISMV